MDPAFKHASSEISRGMRLSKCRKCGCMRGTLENLKASLPTLKIKEARELLRQVKEWSDRLEPQAYPCYGCKFCIPPEAMTVLTKKYPSLASSTLSSCEIKISRDKWPPVEGEYSVLDRSAPVAVSTLASIKLEEKLSWLRPSGLCIVGKTETENIGIDKIIKNVVSNPAIHYLILAGKDTAGHQSGKTLLALLKNGVDKDMRVTGSQGRRPILKNVTPSDVEVFRRQVKVIDMIGCEDTKKIIKSVAECAQQVPERNLSVRHTAVPIRLGISSATAGAPMTSCGCSCECNDNRPAKTAFAAPLQKKAEAVPKIKADKYTKSVKLDKAGYFLIIPSKKNGNILVEHYSYDNKLLHLIEGKNSRDIYFTIIRNNWLSELSHAAYIGKELARAELSVKKGFKFVQDGA